MHCPRGRVHVYRREPLHRPSALGNDRASWVPGGLCVDVPCSLTPPVPPAQAIRPQRCCLPIYARRRPPAQGLISVLNHTAHPLAVYAWQCGLLPHHARLATGCWPDFAGQGYILLSPKEKFQPGIASSSPKLSQRTRSKPWVCNLPACKPRMGRRSR